MNVCAITTVRVLTGVDSDIITFCLREHGDPELIRELDSGEMLGDDVFTIMGTQIVCRFDIYIYLSDNERVLIKSCGIDIEEVDTHDVRFEPVGLTYEEVKQLPYNPMYVGGHYEPVRDVFAGRNVESPW